MWYKLEFIGDCRMALDINVWEKNLMINYVVRSLCNISFHFNLIYFLFRMLWLATYSCLGGSNPQPLWCEALPLSAQHIVWRQLFLITASFTFASLIVSVIPILITRENCLWGCRWMKVNFFSPRWSSDIFMTIYYNCSITMLPQMDLSSIPGRR